MGMKNVKDEKILGGDAKVGVVGVVQQSGDVSV